MILIDGSYLEGGGQILRTSVAMSAITGQPCRIENIRKGRPNPGLQPQHLKGLEAAAKICNAKTSGLSIGSETVEFFPGKIGGGEFFIDTETAGSVTLIMEALMPICLFAPRQCVLNVTGGTDVQWSPSIHYFKRTFLSSLEAFGLKEGEEYDLSIKKYGFYPRGGGKVVLRTRPFSSFKKIDMTSRGKLRKVDVVSLTSSDLRKSCISERQIDGVEKIFAPLAKRDVLYDDTLSPGSSIFINAIFENCRMGFSALGKRGKKAEDVGEEAAKELKGQMASHACFDENMADQIIPYMALAGGSKISVAKVTNHCRTNIWVIEKFLPVKFDVKGNVISVARA